MSKNPPPHWLDRLVGHAFSLGSKLFERGWGDESLIDRARAEGWGFWPRAAPIDIVWSEQPAQGATIHDGVFRSPLADALPRESANAYVRRLSPDSSGGPAVVMFAASGDQGFAWREKLTRPLVQLGVHVVLLENPLYGLRRPAAQRGSRVSTVSELMVMNRAAVEEARSLLALLRSQGHSPVGVAGFSMGGYMASLTATQVSEPIGVAAMAVGRSAAPIYTTGMLSLSVDWKALARTTGGELQARARLANLFHSGDLDRLPLPKYPEAAIVLSCMNDGYVEPAESAVLHQHWKGSELRHVPTGHAGATFQHLSALRQVILDSLERASKFRQAPVSG
jgi:pimeloyl-ACP methyl ester carboxylesterase